MRIAMDLLLFAATAALATRHQKACAADAGAGSAATCGALRNRAFVFVKPHANVPAARALVGRRLREAGLEVAEEGDIDAATIDQKRLIDQHYYAIASKATLLPAQEIPVPPERFQTEFGEAWEAVLREDRACNALEACRRFGCDSRQLDAAWRKAEKVVKFGGGFYCGLVALNGKELYVFNAFFMSMRAKFVEPGCSIHYYVVEFSPDRLSWSDFRNVVLGPTDPAEAPVGSLRRTILDEYEALGLAAKPDKGDNGVHASASPFEGLAEQMNWLGKSIEDLAFGRALLAAGLSAGTIKEWSVDPRVVQPDGALGSVFDALEDTDVDECLAKLVKLNDLNANAMI